MNYALRNLIIALGLAVLGIILTASYIGSQKQQLQAGKEYKKVLVAEKDIAPGTSAATLESGGYVTTKEVLAADKAPQALSNLEDVEKLSVNSTIHAGMQITAHDFEHTAGLAPTAQLKGTERWLAVPMGPFQTIAGLIRPGDHVDLYASSEVKDACGKDEACVVTYVVARDVNVVQTPTSLAPVPEGESAPAEPAAAGADKQIYMLQVSDEVAQEIMYSFNAAGDNGLWATLRPSDGAQETKSPPLSHIPVDN